MMVDLVDPPAAWIVGTQLRRVLVDELGPSGAIGSIGRPTH
jgi:hypothetical protein